MSITSELVLSKISMSKISPLEQQNFSRLVLTDLSLSGGFGSIYKTTISDGKNSCEFAVKVFHDTSGSHGYKTINNLITKINEFELNQSSSLASIASLKALPIFSFEGTLKGKLVKGYVTYYLSHNDYASLDEVLTNHRKEYSRKLRLDDRLFLAEQLCKGLQALEKLTYIHADINAQNIFINLSNLDLVIIDFDSGAITDGSDNIPSTWGKPNEWIAPEVRKQIDDKKASIKINIHTDRFSAMVGVHYLIFMQSPYCFLKNMSNPTMVDYLNKYQWPNEPSNRESYFHRSCNIHTKIIKHLKAESPTLFKVLYIGFNDGYFNISRRVGYGQLLARLKNKQNIQSRTLLKNNFCASKSTPLIKQIINGIVNIKTWFVKKKDILLKVLKYLIILIVLLIVLSFVFNKMSHQKQSTEHAKQKLVLYDMYSLPNNILSFSKKNQNGNKIEFFYTKTVFNPADIKKGEGSIDIKKSTIYLDGIIGKVYVDKHHNITKIEIGKNIFISKEI